MKVQFSEGRNGDPVVTNGKIGVVDRGTRLQPRVGEEWEVELVRDTAPGERRGVRILRPIRRIEEWTADKERRAFILKSGDCVLETRPATGKLEDSFHAAERDSFGNICHMFRADVPDDLQGQVEGFVWTEKEPVPDDEPARLRAMLDAWKDGKTSAHLTRTYRHRYGGELQVTWEGSVLDTAQEIAVLHNGHWLWSEVKGSFFGLDNETHFAGGPVLVKVPCVAKNSDEWLRWALQTIYTPAIAYYAAEKDEWMVQNLTEAQEKLRTRVHALQETLGPDAVPNNIWLPGLHLGKFIPKAV